MLCCSLIYPEPPRPPNGAETQQHVRLLRRHAGYKLFAADFLDSVFFLNNLKNITEKSTIEIFGNDAFWAHGILLLQYLKGPLGTMGILPVRYPVLIRHPHTCLLSAGASDTADTLFQEVLGRKDKADSTRNALNVLQRFKFLFNLPLNIERNIQKVPAAARASTQFMGVFSSLSYSRFLLPT